MREPATVARRRELGSDYKSSEANRTCNGKSRETKRGNNRLLIAKSIHSEPSLDQMNPVLLGQVDSTAVLNTAVCTQNYLLPKGN